MELKTESNHNVNKDGFVSDSLNMVQIERRYELEQEMLHAVKWGNPYKVEDLLEMRRKMFPDLICCGKESAMEALRCCKNELVALNALCRFSARLGGVQPLYLHSLANKYALMIENAVSIAYLSDVLYAQIAIDYATAVLEFSVNSYSPMIKKIVTYLTVHLTEDVRIEQLGKMHNTHISHISRKFKKETGMSIPAYVSKQRVGLAKLYFEDGRTSIRELAELLGFNDSNYFSKVFKRYAGMTPTEYINSIHER
ncbi:MAG: AraC family transcriptional regulator [Sphaerochaetaceae bacterium]|nr:AraC family transcriptional regulator [Sphaerochaetaceae bacterium]